MKTLSAILVVLSLPGLAQPDHHNSEYFPIVEGSVNQIVTGDHYTVLRGDIRKIGPYVGTAISLNATTGSRDNQFPLFHGEVTAAIQDGNGGWFVGSVANDDFYIQGLTHVKADKTVDEDWGPAIDYGIKALALDGNILYVGGSFTESSSSQGFPSRRGLAAFNATTGEILSWDPDVVGTVNTLEVLNGIVYVGGQFTEVGGELRKNIAAVDGVTGIVTEWDPSVDGVNSYVSDIEISSDSVFVGGQFTTAGGALHHSLASISSTTGSAFAWNPDPDAAGKVNVLLLSGSTVFVGGSFVTIGGQSRKHLAAVGITSGIATAWNPNFDAEAVNALALSGATLFAGGSFATVNGTNRGGLASISKTTGTLTAWNPNPQTTISCISLSGDVLLAGSKNNIMYGWTDSNGYSMINNETGEVIPVTIDPNGEVTSMIIAYDVLYMSGTFTQVNGQARNQTAAIDLNNGNLLSWSPITNGDVKSIAFRGTNVYLGGNFSTVNTIERKGLASVHLTTGDLQTWSANLDDGDVSAIFIYDDRLYIGGTFTSVKGELRNRVAALDLTTGNVLSQIQDDGELEDVFQIRANADQIVIRDAGAGLNSFTTEIGEIQLYRLYTDEPINDIVIANDLLIIGGTFNVLDQDVHVGLASINLTNSAVTSWYPDVWQDGNGNPAVRALGVAGDKLLVAGSFETIGFEKRKGFGAFDLSLAHCSELDPVTSDETTLSAPEGNYYQWFKNGEAVDGATTRTFELDQELSAMYKVVVIVNDCPNTWLSYENIVLSTERTNRSMIRAYPNPVRNRIKIETPNQEIQSVVVRNILGAVVATKKLAEDNTIDISGLPAGYLILTVRTNRGTNSIKLSKID